MAKTKADIRHSQFIKEYLKCLNGTRAYMKVYPDATYETARTNASVLLSNANVQKEIKERLKSVHMSVDEDLKILSDHARGSLEHFIDEDGNIDFDTAKELGLLHLIKEYEIVENASKDNVSTRKRIKLHDPQKALELIGKYYAIFTDKKEITEKKIIKVTFTRDD
jgi:phage terminase small subunit